MVRFCFRAKASSYNNNVVDLGIKDFRNDERPKDFRPWKPILCVDY